MDKLGVAGFMSIVAVFGAVAWMWGFSVGREQHGVTQPQSPEYQDSVAAFPPTGLPALAVAVDPANGYPPKVGSIGDYVLIAADQRGFVHAICEPQK